MFTSKQLASLYNSERLEQLDGDHMAYFTVDHSEPGKKSALGHITAPKMFEVKENCPVVLIKNISTNLVNELQGKVQCALNYTIDVYFPSVKLRHTFERVQFEQYSSAERRILASKMQFPLDYFVV